MFRSLKHLVPLSLRRPIKWLGFAVLDVVSGPSAPRVPARRHTFIGGGDFVVVGDDFRRILKDGGLTSDMAVLDVGCGQGRLARPLAEFLSPQGSYAGFDIVRSGVEWCQKHYADLPNFQFDHADIYNDRYNKDGPVLASEYRFPYPDNTFDRAVLMSVFTHMTADDIENYLYEIARVLKPGGQAMTTWFLLNPVSDAAIKSGQAQMDFRFDYDDNSRTTLKGKAEAAIAFDEDYVRGLYAAKGLEVSDPINYGHWRHEEDAGDLQDIVTAAKL